MILPGFLVRIIYWILRDGAMNVMRRIMPNSRMLAKTM